jgi:hypothetical protein
MKKLTTFQKWGLAAAALLIPIAAFAGVRGVTAAGVDLGPLTGIKCSTNLTCTKVNNMLNMVATSASLALASDEVIANASDDVITMASNDSDIIVSINSPLTSNGDATLRLSADASADSGDDWQLLHDGATNDLIFQNDKSGSQATFLTLTEDGEVTLAGTTPHFNVGDAGAEDAGVTFDGNAQDYHITLKDSTDDLVIGLGVAAGTTDAIRIDENQIVTFVQGVEGLGTDTLHGFLQSQVASTTTTITAAQCGKTFVSNSADVMALPEASTVLGCRYTFVCGTADNFDINPDDADVIGPVSTTDGTTGVVTLAPSAGDAIRCTDVGGSITIEAVGAALWAQVAGGNGVWTDVD